LMMPTSGIAAYVVLGVSLAIHAGSIVGVCVVFVVPESFLRRLLRRFPKAADFICGAREFVAETIRSGLAWRIAFFVMIIWVLTLAQYACFFAALNYAGNWLAVPAFIPAAILAGIMPLTVAGIGTRDAAILLLFNGFAAAELATGVGLLSHLRYLLPGIVGAFVVRRMV